MPENTDVDLTLPSVVASLSGKYREPGLVLTVIFHPLTARIGETALVPRRQGATPWVLGRRSPAFKAPGVQQCCPLKEPHVSRRALELDYNGRRLILRRLEGSSRCRVDGRELRDSVELDHERLLQGVPLLLGHAVVLLLRLGECLAPGTVEQASGSVLRGGSAYMDGLRKQVAQVGASDLDVLIRGETGTGKELVANEVHTASGRGEAPLVSVNMAAIPAELAAAALFGSARGAFTGANKAAVGYFEQARGGSLFLDEIGDTPAAVQPQLLRALQQREIQCVGGPIRQVDVRVISATDAALEGKDCDFKAALRHRLAASEIQLLPLREHPEDIGELLLHFLHVSCAEVGRTRWLPREDGAAPDIAAWAELFHNFVCYPWPGNIRELANFARQIVLASEQALTLPDSVLAALGQGRSTSQSMAAAGIDSGVARRRMQDIDEPEFDRVLQANRFEVANTARQLGVSRQSVYRRIEDSPEHRLASQVPLPELRRVLADLEGDIAAVALQLRVSLTGLRARLRHLDIED